MLNADRDETDVGASISEEPASEVGTAVTDEPTTEGHECENCGQPPTDAGLSVCPHCGYYASLGICVEVDKRWEKIAQTQLQQTDGAVEEQPAKSHLQVWLELVPPWGWRLIAGNVAVLAGSVAVRILLTDDLPRMLWSVTQLLAGLTLFCACHFFAYLVAIAEDASLGILDVILKPIGIWKDVFRNLPEKIRIAMGGTCGLTAVLGSVLIIGALPYGVLLDWGIKEPPKRNLLGAVVARAREVEGDANSLDDAVGDFAGSAGDVADADTFGGSEEREQAKNVRVDCVILGYTVDANNHVSSLVLAREFQGKLIFIGRLSDGFTDELREEYGELFAEIPRQQPFVTVPAYISARWLQPKYACRVKCLRETSSGKLLEMELDDILGAIN